MVQSNADKSFDFFLKSDFSGYNDKEWLAICGNKVVAHGLKLKEVMERAKCVSGTARPLFTRVKKAAIYLHA